MRTFAPRTGHAGLCRARATQYARRGAGLRSGPAATTGTHHGTTGTLSDPRDHRRRRDGARLQGLRPRDRPGDRDQAAEEPARRRRPVPDALPARGQGRRDAVASEHRHDLRRRHRRQAPVHRDGAGRRHDADRPDPLRPAHADARHRRDRHPAHARARLRAQEGHHPPRHQAGQHHAGGDQQPGEGHRLRHLPDRQGADQRAHAAHAARRRAGHAELHVARAGAGPEGRFALRPLQRSASSSTSS